MNEDKVQVLIADDEDPLRMTIAAWLSDEGFEVEEVGDGVEAIKKTQAKDYDIALLDIKMPVQTDWKYCVTSKRILRRQKLS